MTNQNLIQTVFIAAERFIELEKGTKYKDLLIETSRLLEALDVTLEVSDEVQNYYLEGLGEIGAILGLDIENVEVDVFARLFKTLEMFFVFGFTPKCYFIKNKSKKELYKLYKKWEEEGKEYLLFSADGFVLGLTEEEYRKRKEAEYKQYIVIDLEDEIYSMTSYEMCKIEGSTL